MTAIHLLNNRRFVFVLHLFQQNTIKFRKKKAPQKAFLTGLFLEGLIFGGKFAFQTRRSNRSLQVAVEGEEWMVLATVKYDYGIF